MYSYSLEELGVMISYSKSLVSHQGAAEFAKRFRVRNHPFLSIGLIIAL